MALTKYESFDDPILQRGTIRVDLSGTAQTFTPQATHSISRVILYLKLDTSEATPGILTVSIQALDGNGFPDGSALASGTYNANLLSYDWPCQATIVDLNSAPVLQANTEYAIVARVENDYPNNLGWGFEDRVAYGYARGRALDTTFGDWAAYFEDYDLYFSEWGTPAYLIPGFPADRPATYDEDKVWGYDTDTGEFGWLAPEDAEVSALGGGRYENRFVAVTDKGGIFFK